jgi:hypothetical protein
MGSDLLLSGKTLGGNNGHSDGPCVGGSAGQAPAVERVMTKVTVLITTAVTIVLNRLLFKNDLNFSFRVLPSASPSFGDFGAVVIRLLFLKNQKVKKF